MSAGHLLDTVVVSELRKGKKAEAAVIAWQAGVAPASTYLSVITLVEIRQGIRQVAARDPDFATRLRVWYRDQLLVKFHGRVLAVTREVAEAVSELPAKRTLPAYDALIAATAHVHDLKIATRNVADFADTGVSVVNPWEPPLP